MQFAWGKKTGHRRKRTSDFKKELSQARALQQVDRTVEQLNENQRLNETLGEGEQRAAQKSLQLNIYMVRSEKWHLRRARGAQKGRDKAQVCV